MMINNGKKFYKKTKKIQDINKKILLNIKITIVPRLKLQYQCITELKLQILSLYLNKI